MGCAGSAETAKTSGVSAHKFIEPERFFERYALAESLGEGSFGEVCAVQGRVPGEKSAAAKILSLHSAETMQRAHEEYNVWRRLEAHPNVVQLQGFCLDFQGPGGGRAYLLMERCDETLRQRLGLFSVTGALGFPLSKLREVFRCMLSAVAHLHDHGVVHRDVNVDNFLMASGSDTEVKLCDFGSAVALPRCGSLRSPVSASPYTAPEVVRGEAYGPAMDVWSCGVCVFNVLFDDFPYKPLGYEVVSGTPHEESFAHAIRKGKQPRFHPRRTKAPVSTLASSVAKALLTRNAQLRPTAAAALQLQLFQLRLSRSSSSQDLCASLDRAKSADLSELSTDASDSEGKVNSCTSSRETSRLHELSL